jgi:hypothetical protein
MKFLIIMRRNPGAASYDNSTPETLAQHAENLRMGLDKGHVHFAAALLSGGGVYVVEADNARDLAYAVRKNPLYKSCSVEIEPIVDADVFLKHAAQAVGKMKK